MPNDRMWDPEGIPDSSSVPLGTYNVSIVKIEESETQGKEGSKLPAGCLMYVGEFEITDAPDASLVGLHLFDRYVIGSERDPHAKDPETWKQSIGSKSMKRMLVASRTTITNNLTETLRKAEGNQLTVFVTERVAGSATYNDMKRYHPLGERAVGFGDQPPPRPVVGAPAAGAGRPPARPNGPTAPTAQATPPATTARPAAKKARAETIPCPECGEVVARDAFRDHMTAHDEGDAA